MTTVVEQAKVESMEIETLSNSLTCTTCVLVYIASRNSFNSTCAAYCQLRMLRCLVQNFCNLDSRRLKYKHPRPLYLVPDTTRAAINACSQRPVCLTAVHVVYEDEKRKTASV